MFLSNKVGYYYNYRKNYPLVFTTFEEHAFVKIRNTYIIYKYPEWSGARPVLS